MARLRAEASFASSALEMLILTATRSGEARGMRWDEIDFDNAVWTIPAERMKRKLPHEVPLSSAALAILKRLEPGRIGPLVFPGRSNAKPIENVTVWTLVQNLSGREEGAPVVASNHGFRSTARTWMAHRGVPFDVAEQCLAHKVGSKVSQRYNRETFLERRREVMEMWSQFLTGEGSADVVPLRRA